MSINVSTIRPLIAGDVIFEAKPVVYIVYNDSEDKYCNNCLKNSKQLKKCSKCRQMYYCDKNCQRIDWKYHKNECKVFTNKKFKPKESNFFELLLIRFWFAIKSDETFVTKRFQLFNGSDISINQIQVNVKELSEDIDRMIEFQLISNHFNDFEIEFNRKELLHWFGLITTSGIRHQLISYDTYIGGLVCDDSILAVGLGLYPELYAVNHSCLPNSAVVINGLSLQLRAMKSITVGTQVTRIYIDWAQNKTDRKKDLKKKFLIDCKCVKCEQNLDSHIDYNKINSILWEHSLKSNNLLTTVPFSALIEEFHKNMKEFHSFTEYVLPIVREVLGEYSPALTLLLISELKLRPIAKHCINRVVSGRDYHTVEEHIRITHGVNHPVHMDIVSHKPNPYFQLVPK